MRRKSQPTTKSDPGKPTPLANKVDQLLTEARVIIPGAQALLGFQLSMTLMQNFQQLSPEAKIIHVIALCCIGLAVILLMAPASLHRISFAGEDDPAFLKVGSIFVIAAPLPLALGSRLRPTWRLVAPSTRPPLRHWPSSPLLLCSGYGTFIPSGGGWPLAARARIRSTTRDRGVRSRATCAPSTRPPPAI